MNILSFFSIPIQLTLLMCLSMMSCSLQPTKPLENGLYPLKSQQKNNPYRGNRTVEDIGYQLYKANCIQCHGENAISQGKAPDLRFLPTAEYGDDFYLKSVLEGKKSVNIKIFMPAFANKLTQEEIWAIRTWVETIPTGD